MIFKLTDDLVFPEPSLAESDGLLAVGGDLSVERLTLAYSKGIFPWYSDEDPILWFAPHLRCVLFPDKVHVSRSMRRTIYSNRFNVTHNKNFDGVIGHCAEIERQDGNGTWITKEMRAAYQNLHAAGLAHSFEIWNANKLVGGIYGVVINNIFCGESMFSIEKDASKMAMIWICKRAGFDLIDCQIPNNHLISMGAEMIDANEFRKMLSQ